MVGATKYVSCPPDLPRRDFGNVGQKMMLCLSDTQTHESGTQNCLYGLANFRWIFDHSYTSSF